MNKDCFEEFIKIIKVKFTIKSTEYLLNNLSLTLQINSTEVNIYAYKEENIIYKIVLKNDDNVIEFNMDSNPIGSLLKELLRIKNVENNDLKYFLFEKDIKNMLGGYKIISFYDKVMEVNYPTIYYKVFDDKEFIMSLNLYENSICMNMNKVDSICKKYSYKLCAVLPIINKLYGKNLTLKWYKK